MLPVLGHCRHWHAQRRRNIVAASRRYLGVVGDGSGNVSAELHYQQQHNNLRLLLSGARLLPNHDEPRPEHDLAGLTARVDAVQLDDLAGEPRRVCVAPLTLPEIAALRWEGPALHSDDQLSGSSVLWQLPDVEGGKLV